VSTNQPSLAALVADPARFLDATDASIRRLAVSALANRLDDETVPRIVAVLETDPDEIVRAEAAEVLGGDAAAIPALMASRDDSPRVVEAVVTALGSLHHTPAVPWLIEQAAGAEDPLVREAAVAALGEIGDTRAVATLVELSASGPPQVRRRAVVALTVFDGPEVESAIRVAAGDRNPMVREAAQMVVGRPDEWQKIELRVDPEN
jgi:HEAT repeat protein